MGGNSDIDREIAQIARQQHGNISRRQLLAAGLDDDAIRWRVLRGRLFRVFRGVYAVGRPQTTALEKAAAVVLACGDRAALSHSSAMALWGLWRRWDEPLELVVAGDRRSKGMKVHRAAGLLRRDIRTEQCIRVTSPARALLDCAPRMPRKALTRRINEALRAEILTRADLRDVVARFPLHPGAALLGPHAETDQKPTRSGFEDDFLAFCERYGLPVPQINVMLHAHEVDAYFEPAKLVVELDGWGFHHDRQAFEDDRERDATMLLHGVATVRITRARVRGAPEREADRLRAIIAARSDRPAV